MDVLSGPQRARFGRKTVMKINGKTMMAVVMVIGSLAATGCSTASAQDTGLVAPEETAATAPVDNASGANAGVEKDGRFFHYYAPFAPPAARFEIRGVAPSLRHFWAPGYHRWNGREHVWVAGRWELRRDGFEFIGPHWVRRFGRFEYIPGRWIRRF
jgi:hypothetical protein